MFFLNNVIEHHIGSFRLNMYVLGMAVCLVIPALLPFVTGAYINLMPIAFFTSIMLAAATLAPNYEIMLMFVIPIKMKWLALASVALLFWSLHRSPSRPNSNFGHGHIWIFTVPHRFFPRNSGGIKSQCASFSSENQIPTRLRLRRQFRPFTLVTAVESPIKRTR